MLSALYLFPVMLGKSMPSKIMPCVVAHLIGTLRYWNADALKNAFVEEGLDRVYGVRGGKIKLRMCCVRKRQREVSSCDGFIQRNSRSVDLSHASGFITDVEFLLLYEENTSDNLMIR